MSAAPLFVREGDAYVPTDSTRGPWNPAHQHGGPPSALVTHLAEQVIGEQMALARMTIELMRPVPLEPLLGRAEVVRDGRKIQLVDVALVHRDSGQEVVKARALAIRAHDLDTGVPEGAPPPPPESGAVSPYDGGDEVAYHRVAAEHRFVDGEWRAPGPSTVWIRLVVPVIEGREPSGWERVAAVADFGSGVGAALDFEEHTYINADLTISIVRPPVDDWVCLQARTHLATRGIGFTECEIFDRRGRIGRSVQDLVVDVR